MLTLRIKDMHNQSPRCHTDCGNYKEEGCSNGCQMRFRSIFKCSHCGAVSCFYGSNNPIYCQSCKTVLPDYWRLARKQTSEHRVEYHIGV